MSEETKAHNQKTHIRALSMTKLGDGLIDPKIVLSWLMTSLGASAGTIGLLVPVREAGALLPQLFTAPRLRQVAIRKWWWVTGSLLQGFAVLGIAVSSLFLTGNTAGFTIVALVAALALARSISSVSYKDVLGKTVEKPKRGLVTGTASSVAAAGVLVFGGLLVTDIFDRGGLVLGALMLASTLWFLASLLFTTLFEPESETTNVSIGAAFTQYGQYLKHDIELQKYILVRALLTATAVAPPFLLLLASDSINLLSQLGALVIASSFATFVSGRIWGLLSDHSTKLVLAFAGLGGAVFLSTAFLAAGSALFSTAWFLPSLLCLFLISYQGVRIGRTIHLVNLATEDTRAAYTAVSNTIIGVVLLATGLFGLLAEFIGVPAVILMLASMSGLGGLLGFTLKAV